MKKYLLGLLTTLLVLTLTACAASSYTYTIKTSVGNFKVKVSGDKVLTLEMKSDGTGFTVYDDGASFMEGIFVNPESVKVGSDYKAVTVNDTQYLLFQESDDVYDYVTHLGVYGADIGLAIQTAEVDNINYLTLSGKGIKGASADPLVYYTNILDYDYKSVQETAEADTVDEPTEVPETVDEPAETVTEEAATSVKDEPYVINVGGAPLALYPSPGWEIDEIAEGDIGVTSGDLFGRYRDSQVEVGNEELAMEWLAILDCTEMQITTVNGVDAYLGYGVYEDDGVEFYVILQDIGAPNYLEVTIQSNREITSADLSEFLVNVS